MIDKGNLFDIQMLHTDRGSECDNMPIDELLNSYQINRSLSMKVVHSTTL